MRGKRLVVGFFLCSSLSRRSLFVRGFSRRTTFSFLFFILSVVEARGITPLRCSISLSPLPNATGASHATRFPVPCRKKASSRAPRTRLRPPTFLDRVRQKKKKRQSESHRQTTPTSAPTMTNKKRQKRHEKTKKTLFPTAPFAQTGPLPRS